MPNKKPELIFSHLSELEEAIPAPHTTLMIKGQLTYCRNTLHSSDGNELTILFSKVLRMWNKAANAQGNP